MVIRLENSTGLHLMGGPITVFEEGSYAGEALIDDIRPSGKRLLSFSMDLDTSVISEEEPVPRRDKQDSNISRLPYHYPAAA
jgi:hypothetical protein